MIGVPLLAGALRLALTPRARRFEAALRDPAAAQERVRARILAGIQRTTYGAAYRTFDDLPVVDAAALAPWLERQRTEEGRVLVPDPVRFYEPTSGSSGPRKLIPYTRPLLRSFTSLFAVWAHDLLAHGPRFTTGRLYFSVSPSFDPPEATATGLPVGTTDDRDYLGGWLGWALRPFWVTVPGAAAERDPEAFKRRVCLALAAERDLEVLSVWSPSFLLVLLDWMERHRQELPNPALVGRWTELWPALKLVSCWDEAGAGPGAARLRALFPGVLVQGKGLLATEAPVTVPLVGRGTVPLVDEVVVELEVDGRVVPLHAAQPGTEGALVVSQCAGLVRYRLGDRVRVGPRVEATPTLTLLGRGEGTDLCGEKLTEAFVRDALAGVGLAASGYCTLIARTDHYVLLVDRSDWPPDTLASLVDEALGAAHHYRHARRMGQLGPVRVVLAPDILRGRFAPRGVKWGGEKHRLLRANAGELESWLE